MMTTPAPQPARTRTAVLAMFLCIACHPGGSAKPDSSSMAAVDSSRSADSAYRFLDQPGLPVDSVAAVQARLPYDSISLRRDPCFGTCPMYEVTLYRNGRARYKGLRFVDRIGTWRGEVTIQDYARLSYLLDHLGFMSMPDSFAAASTDLPGATLSAHRTPGGAKAIKDYGYVGPVELWTMREIVDGIAGRISWEKVSNE